MGQKLLSSTRVTRFTNYQILIYDKTSDIRINEYLKKFNKTTDKSAYK